jgi:hypothetical protein
LFQVRREDPNERGLRQQLRRGGNEAGVGKVGRDDPNERGLRQEGEHVMVAGVQATEGETRSKGIATPSPLPLGGRPLMMEGETRSKGIATGRLSLGANSESWTEGETRSKGIATTSPSPRRARDLQTEGETRSKGIATHSRDW